VRERRQLWIASIFVVLALAGLSLAAEENARGILVGTLKPGLTLTIDKGCGATYAHGELLTAVVRSERSGYLTLFDFMPNGRVQIVFPNAYYQTNYIEAEREYRIPGDVLPFDFRIGPPDGWEILYGVVTSQPFTLMPNVSYDYGQGLAQLPSSAEDTARSLARGIDVIPAEIWSAVAFCYFQVKPAPTPTHPAVPSTTPSTTPTPPAPPTPSTTPATPPVQQQAGWALFLGVDDYDETPYTGEDGLKYRFPKLHYCAKGANAMAVALADTFPNQRILVNREVTHDGVKKAVTEWLSQAPENATVLVFYSGHGSRVKDKNGDEADGYDETIVPWDYGTKQRYIIDDELREWLSAVKAERVVLIFDSCHSGTMERGVMTAELLTTGTRATEPSLTDGMAEDFGQTMGVRGIAWKELVISASRPDEAAYESSQLKSSVLTYYLTQALSGKGDADKDAWVTAQEAFQYAKEQIAASYTKQHPQMVDNLKESVRLVQVK
jgi:uncharacterized caspase-like protein